MGGEAYPNRKGRPYFCFRQIRVGRSAKATLCLLSRSLAAEADQRRSHYNVRLGSLHFERDGHSDIGDHHPVPSRHFSRPNLRAGGSDVHFCGVQGLQELRLQPQDPLQTERTLPGLCTQTDPRQVGGDSYEGRILHMAQPSPQRRAGKSTSKAYQLAPKVKDQRLSFA